MHKNKSNIYYYFIISFFLSFMSFTGVNFSFEIIVAINCVNFFVFLNNFKKEHSDVGIKYVFIILTSSVFIYCTFPILFYIFAPKFAVFYNDTLFRSALFNSAFFSWYCFWSLVIFSDAVTIKLDRQCRALFQSFDVSAPRALLVTFAAVIMTSVYVDNYFASGASEAVLNSSRFEVTKAVETGRIWLIQYAMSAYFIWLICFCSFSVSNRPNIFAPILYINAFISLGYLYFYLQLGNRREIIVPILFFFFIRYLKNNKIDKLFLVGAVIALTWIGVSRVTSVSTGSVFGEDLLFAGLGEFVLTGFPLNFYIENGYNELQLGQTILQSVAAGTPLIEAGSKPVSLAQEFVNLYSYSGIGYGFSPMAESFLNFGFLGSILGPLLVMSTIRIISKYPLPHSGLALLVVASFAFDIFRGESGALFWQFVIIYGLLSAFCFKWRPQSDFKHSPTSNNSDLFASFNAGAK